MNLYYGEGGSKLPGRQTANSQLYMLGGIHPDPLHPDPLPPDPLLPDPLPTDPLLPDSHNLGGLEGYTPQPWSLGGLHLEAWRTAPYGRLNGKNID